MSALIDDAVLEAVKLITARAGIQIDSVQAIALARKGADLLAGLIDDHAKKRAQKAGDDAGAAIDSEDEAEAAQRQK